MTDTLRDLASSVDWSKMLSSTDARNALIGSALGGLVLGGAGLMSDRDPEESRYAPVKDALLGAVLGGVAGYAIPKGVELFRNSGTLAPDDDRMSTGVGGAASSALRGFGAGAAMGGALTVPTAWRTFGRMNGRYQTALRNWKRHGSSAGVKPQFGGLKDFIREMGRDGKYNVAALPKGRLPHIRQWLANLTNGYVHYARRPTRGTWLGALFPRGHLSTRGRILGRVGKYGAAGAGLALLSRALFGPSPRDNFSN